MIFRVMVFAFLAIIGVAFLMLILSIVYPSLGSGISCRLYQAITGVVPTSGEMRPTLPWYCYSSECTFVRSPSKATTPEELAETVAFQAYRCWRCADKGNAPRDVLCAELYSEQSTDESKVTEELIVKGHCEEFPNSELEFNDIAASCGEENRLHFNSRELSGTIIIKYDSYAHRIAIS